MLGVIVLLVGLASLSYPVAVLMGEAELHPIAVLFALAAFGGIVKGLLDRP